MYRGSCGYHLLWIPIPATAELIVVQEMTGGMGTRKGKGLIVVTPYPCVNMQGSRSRGF
jgi:hypothetical protein